MSRPVELWMHPGAGAATEPLIARSATRSSVRRSLAVFDALVAHCRSQPSAQAALQEVSPPPLTRAKYQGKDLKSWPRTAEGRQIGAECQEVMLGLYQVGRLRSAVAVVACANEWYVVWLSARLTAEPRADGFIDDADAAQAHEDLESALGLALDLTWLETE